MGSNHNNITQIASRIVYQAICGCCALVMHTYRLSLCLCLCCRLFRNVRALIDLACKANWAAKSIVSESSYGNECWTRAAAEVAETEKELETLRETTVETAVGTPSGQAVSCGTICELCHVDFSFQWEAQHKLLSVHCSHCCSPFLLSLSLYLPYLFICLALAAFIYPSIYVIYLPVSLELPVCVCLLFLWRWPHINPAAC